MRLLAKRYKEAGSVGFILDELAPTVAEAPPAYRVTVSRPAKLARKKKRQAARQKKSAA